MVTSLRLPGSDRAADELQQLQSERMDPEPRPQEAEVYDHTPFAYIGRVLRAVKRSAIVGIGRPNRSSEKGDYSLDGD